MFELLLLIGFLYAGFCPPVDIPRESDAPRRRRAPRLYLPGWVRLKKLVQKNSGC